MLIFSTSPCPEGRGIAQIVTLVGLLIHFLLYVRKPTLQHKQLHRSLAMKS